MVRFLLTIPPSHNKRSTHVYKSGTRVLQKQHKKQIEKLFNVNEYLDSLPDDTKIINVSNHNLNYLPDLTRFKSLRFFHCCNNVLESLPNLPASLERLLCFNNKLRYLPFLPKKLEYLDCSQNLIGSLPVLPPNLEVLNCSRNKLYKLSNVNDKLLYF